MMFKYVGEDCMLQFLFFYLSISPYDDDDAFARSNTTGKNVTFDLTELPELKNSCEFLWSTMNFIYRINATMINA